MMKPPSSPAPHPALPAGWAIYAPAAEPGPAPAGPRQPLAFAGWLPLEPAYQALQAPAGPVLSFFLEDAARQLTVAQLYVALDYPVPGQAASPAREATFGGVQLAPEVPAAAVHALLAAAEAALRQHGQRTLRLRGPASYYDPAPQAQLHAVLRERGYEPQPAAPGYYLDPARDYRAHLQPGERRRLRRCQAQGLVPEQEPPLILPWAHEFIAGCWQARGYPPPPPLAYLQTQFRAFPRQHLLFSVRKPGSGDWAALTIAVQTSEGVLSSWLAASAAADDQLSPAVLLAESLHAYARAGGLAAVDLGGAAALPGGQAPPASLRRFWRHLGAVAGEWLSWEKVL